ncbi:MAG: PfkB family carbohydrate kinase, partial [Acidimicrobiaceae bacterium]|nr:PfkB family carbohydrate kinase [Acidimicrobiaceae bacterium]
AVGADRPGAELLEVLEAEGIDRSRVRIVPDAPTGVALIAVAAGGENTVVVAAGANGTVAPDQLDGFGWRRGDVLVCQLEIPLATVEVAMRAAREGGARTLLNPAPATAPLAPSLLALVDVLVPNEGEARTLAGGGLPAGGPAPGGSAAGGSAAGGSAAGGSAADAGRALAARSGGVVIVTLGAQGSLWCTASAEPVRVPAPAVRAVDTTGAGDAYCGALAAALAGGADLRSAVRRASVAGSLATTRHGAVPSIPTAGEVDDLLAGGGDGAG